MSELDVQQESPKSVSRRWMLKAGLALPVAAAFQHVRVAEAQTEPHFRLNLLTGKDNPVSMDQLGTYEAAIRTAMSEIQAWYATQLDGQTFNFRPELTMRTLGLTTDQIRCGLNPDQECVSDRRKIFAQAWQSVFHNERTGSISLALTKNIVDIFFLRGAGEQAQGGTMGSTNAGYVVMGDLALEGLSSVANELSLTCAQSPHLPEFQCTRPSAVAALAHEIGHIAVPHNSHDGTTLMGGNIGSGLQPNGLPEHEKPAFKSSMFFQHRI